MEDIPVSHLPDDIRRRIDGYRWRRDALGRSGSDVFLLERNGDRPLVLKWEDSHALSELPGEAARLQWLGSVGLPAPEVVACESSDEAHFLLMTALDGRDLASSEQSPETRVTALAFALQQLHAIDPRRCPFHRDLDVMLAKAQERMLAGLVDEEDFDEARLGRSASDLYQELLRLRPGEQELVVVHGDASLPNLMIEGGAFSGFIDVGRLGVADRYVDLSIACASVSRNFGPEWVDVLLARYGLASPDGARLAYYRLLDEFF